MKLYNEEISNEEIITFVKDYVDKVKKKKNDRYHDILSLIPNHTMNILDYGCGWGHYSVGLNEMGHNVTGIDLSKNEIDISNLVWGNKPNLKFERKNITELNNDSFDLVLSNQVIEHVHNAGNYLMQINRILKKNGYLVIGLPNIINPRFFWGLMNKNLENTLHELSNIFLTNYNKTHHHVNAWDPTHFVQLAASLGFKFDKYVPMEGVALPFFKHFKHYIYTKNKRLKNLSYTMAFRFIKVEYIQIDNLD